MGYHMEAPHSPRWTLPYLKAERNVLIPLRSVPSGLPLGMQPATRRSEPWACSLMIRDQEGVMLENTYRMGALFSLEPAVLEELLREWRNLLTNKLATQGLYLLVFSQILISLKQEPYLIYLFFVFFILTRCLLWTEWLDEIIWHWVSAKDLKVQLNLGLCVFILTVNLLLSEQNYATYNHGWIAYLELCVLETQGVKIKTPGARKGTFGEWFRLGADKCTSPCSVAFDSSI